ncbi:hypothetical protein KSF78_0009610, partial [Schistosoma japonicum]
ISPSTLYGEEGGARHSYQFFNSQLITANQLTPTASRHQLYMGKKVVHDIPTNFLIHNSSPPINLHPQHLAINFIWGRSISPSTLYGEEGGARHSYQFFNSQLITANQLTPTASRHQLYMGKKVVHDIPTNFLIHNSSPPINLHPQHLAINFIWGRSISPSTLYGEEGGARHSYQFFNSQLITANQLTPTASRHQLYMGKKVVHDIPTNFLIHNSSPPINLHPQHLAINFIWGRSISPSTLYGEEGGARHSYQFFNSQLITANQLTPTASRHQLYMGKKVVHDIPTNFLIHNSSPPINLHPQHLAINFIWGRSISPSTLYGEEGGARHSYQFFNSQLITANQLTPTASRHQLYMGKKVVHDIPTNFLIHNSSPPINLHPQHLAINFIWGRSISPSTLYGEEGGARHSYQFFNSQLITANQLTPTASRHQLYMGKKVVHDIPTNFLIHNSSPPINLHPQHLAINFIWGRSISPSTLYGEEGGARHSYQFFNSQLITANQLTPTASRHQLYMGKKVVHDIPTNFLIHNSSPPINLHPQHLAINFIWGRSISPSTLYGEEGGARHSYQFFNSQLITANQLTPTASRHQLYMGKKVVHDIPTNFLIHNSSPPINLHPQHLAINFIWGRSISPSTLYGEEGGARHSYQFFNSQLITANQLTPTASRHQLYMGKKVVHDIPTNFLIHNSSPPINLHPQHLAINFIWGRSISPSTLYGEEGGARHSYQFFNSQLITANQLTPTASRHQLYMGKKVVHDIPTNFLIHNSSPPINLHPQHLAINFIWGRSISPSTLYGEEGGARHSYQFFNSQLITANQLTPTASRHQLYMGKKVVHDIPTNFLIHNSSPPINLHPQHLAINFIWGRSISPSTLYGEEGGARHSYQFFNSQLITANQLTPTASRHQLYMGKKVVHDIPTNFLIHNSSPPINLHPQHLAINFIWGRSISPSTLYGEEGGARHSYQFFNSQLITANQLTPTASRHQLYMGKKVVHDIPTNFLIHNSSPPINLHPQHLAINFIWGRRWCTTFLPIFNSQLITANQLTPTASRHQLYMGKKVVHDIPTNFLIHNSSPPINLHPQHLAINFIWGRSISPSTLYGEEGGARHSYQFFNSQLITANQLTPTASRHQLYMGKKVVHDIPTNFLIHNSSPPINLHPQHLAINFIWGRSISPSTLYGEEGGARHSYQFFNSQLITANQLTPTASRHQLYMGKKVVHDIPTNFLIHNSSPPINLHPQHLAINFIWGRSISPSTLYGEEGGARHSYQFFNSQLITANQLTPTASRHQLYMGKKVVHDIPTNFLIHNSSPPINLHPQHLAINFIWGRSISPSTLYGEEGGARHSYQFFNSQLITANQLTPTASRHQLYMGKKVVHDIPTNFLIHNSSPPINLHPQHLAINFIWGRSISPSTLYGEEGGARHSYQFFNSQLITANQLTPTASRHQLYMGKKVVHDIPTNFLIHNSSPPINLHPQHLAINFIWGRSISPSTLYGEEGGARHSYQFFNSQLITANQLTPTASRHQLYMGKKVVHDIPTNFLIHNSSPPINLHPQHLAINFIWGRSISPSTLYGEEGGARHSYQFFNSQLITANQLTPTASRHQLYMGKKVVHDIPTNFLIHNSSPPINLHPQHLAINFIWGRRWCTTFLPIFNSQLITANQLTPTASRHQLYMGKKVVHDIPTNFLIHNSSPPINLHPQHLAINFIWGRSISPSTLYGEEGGARHSYQFFNSQLITANQLTPTASRHQLYMGKKVVHDIPTNFLIHNSSPPINLHPQHLAINFIWGRSISPSTLYGEEGGARHSYQFFNSQLITANQLTPTASRHQLYMGKKVVHDIPTNFLIHNSSPPINLHPQHLAINFIWGRSISPSTLYGEEGGARHSYQFFNSQLITANQLTPTASRHQLYMGKKVVHDIPTNFLIHNSSPPINLHPQHLAINFIWGRRWCTTFLPIFNSQLITANQLTPTASRHQLYMGKKVVHDIPTNFLIHNSSPPINLHPQHLAINFIWGRRWCTTFLPIFNSQLITANQLTPTASRHQLYMGKKVVHDIPTNFLIHNSSPPINLHPQHLAINFIWGRRWCTTFLPIFNSQLITANQLTPTASRHQLYMGKKVVHDIPTNFLIHNSSPPINLHPQHLAINFIWGRSISPSTLYGEEGGARHSYQFLIHNSSPPINLHPQHLAINFIWGRRWCTTFLPIFNSQLITANQLTPTASRHQLYMGKKVVHDIPTNFLIHNSSPPINLHPQHLAINFIWGRSISPSTLYGEEGGARHSYQFFNSQLITANQLTPTASRHQLYMGKKVVHDIPTNFLIHNSSPPINLHPQHLAINFIWGRSISPSTLYGEEGGARHSYQFFNSQLITANQLTPTASRHQLYMGKKVVHDIPTNFLIHNSSPPINLHPQHLAINFIWGRSISPSTLYGEEGGARHSYQFFNSQLITANQLTPTASRHQLYMGKKVVHDIPTNFLIHNSSPPINLHPQHLAINFIWGRSISPSTLYGEEGGARHSYQFFNSQLITANQLTPTASRHQLYMGKKMVHDIPTNFLIHNSSPPINLHPQHLAINFIWGRRWCTTFLPIFNSQLITANQLTPTASRHQLYMGKKVVHDIPTNFLIHNSSPPINLHPQHLAINFIWGRRWCTTFLPIFNSQLITANQLTPTASRHQLYMGKKVVHDIPTNFLIHNSSPPINLHPQHLAINFIWGRRWCTTFLPIFNSQLITANQLTPTASRHQLYMGKKVVHDIPTNFLIHNSSPPINLHPQHLAINFIWGRRWCTTFLPIF